MEIKIPVSSIYRDKKDIIHVYNDKKHYGYYDNRDENVNIKQLLESKRPNIAEVELTLFENCDINCAFCYHDKKSTVGLEFDEMVAKIAIIEKFFQDRQGTVDFMQINVVGGELFQDNLIEKEYLDYYYEISKEINRLADKYEYALEMVWVSNFLFKDTKAIADFMDRLDDTMESSLIVSYDFEGRPTNKKYFENIKRLEKYISSVNIVATIDTINDMMTMTDPFFDYIYHTFSVYIDDYIPDDISNNLTPLDSVMLKFYKFLYHNYPKVVNIAELLENTENPMGCLSLNKITIFPDDSVSNCKWGRYKPENFETYKDTKVNYQDNAPQMERHLQHYNCLSCEFYKRCKFRCYTQWDFITPDIHDYDGCWIKTFFKYINENT